MRRTALAAAAIVLASGCDRNATGPEGLESVHPVIQVVIIEGLAGVEPEISSTHILRIPGYYDFSPFDSIRVSFTAERLTPGGDADQILVRLGPTCTRRESLSVPRKDFSVMFLRNDLSKPAMSALSFFTPDPDASIVLSGLKVIGWTVL